MSEKDRQNNKDMIYEKNYAKEILRLAASLAAMVFLTAIVIIFDIPNPNMILITGLSVFTSLYGYGSGIVCGAVMIVYSMYFFSTGNDFVTYNSTNLQKIAVIVIGVVMNVIFIGHLHRVNRRVTNALLNDNNKLAAASTVDHLTGIKNRFALRRDFSGYDKSDIHVMMLDLDDFKKINDTYGHATGDYILRETGFILREIFGAECSYRYGGDEFLVIIKDISNKDFTDRVSEMMNTLGGIYLEDKPIKARFSAGYTFGRTELPNDLRLMIRQADKSLYEAKHNGKDQFTGQMFSRSFAETD